MLDLESPLVKKVIVTLFEAENNQLNIIRVARLTYTPPPEIQNCFVVLLDEGLVETIDDDFNHVKLNSYGISVAKDILSKVKNKAYLDVLILQDKKKQEREREIQVANMKKSHDWTREGSYGGDAVSRILKSKYYPFAGRCKRCGITMSEFKISPRFCITES